MGNVAKYQHGWNMTFTVVELLMIIPKSTYLSISLPYFSIYHFFSLTLYNITTHIPFLIIHDDRLDIYEQRKRTYRTIYFKDVKQFRLISIYSNNYIAIDYCTVPLMRKMDNASCLTQRMMIFNVSVSGAIESILVQNLTMRGKEICNTLNNRMKIWRSNCN